MFSSTGRLPGPRRAHRPGAVVNSGTTCASACRLHPTRPRPRALRPPRRPARPDPPRSASSRRSSWLAGVVCVTRPRVGRVPGGCVRPTPSCGTASARSVVVAPDDLGAHSGSPARTRDRAGGPASRPCRYAHVPSPPEAAL
jgi:hypothetical protein